MKKKKNKKSLTPEQVEMVLRPLTDEQMESLSKEDLLVVLRGEQKLRKFFEEAANNARAISKELEDKVLELEGKLVIIKCRLLSPKSEKSPKKSKEPNTGEKRKPLSRNRNLEERYPDADVIEKEIKLEQMPSCPCCQGQMNEMGVFEQSQSLTVIEKKYLITNILRMKYHCSQCHGHIETAPQLPRVVPRGTYGDEFLIDVAVSKYCDLLPVERYCEMAARGGFIGLPPNSLHEGLWRLGEFLRVIYELIRIETLDSRILYGDETPHKMLEGDEKSNWYFWGFFSLTSCFFECHDTRSGEIALDVLSESECRYFVSDAYTGYGRAINEVNKLRVIAEVDKIIEVLCNSHARRYFDECGELEDANTFIAEYQEIYKVEKEVKELIKVVDANKESEFSLALATTKRSELKINFERMKTKAESDLNHYSSHHQYYKACQYFTRNYTGLTACLDDPRIPLDNNHSERGLRASVVGRKTWYGTHSERGAETAAIHFTIAGACKLNGVNPRKYYKHAIESIHFKRPLLTPSQYKNLKI
jgi:transposase